MPDMTAPVIAYASHLLAGAVVFSGFFFVYLRLTPYDEFKLIREGNIAAALSLSGALLGFVLTIASSITHADGLVPFLFWAVMASVVQLIVFLVLTRLMPDYRLADRAQQHRRRYAVWRERAGRWRDQRRVPVVTLS